MELAIDAIISADIFVIIGTSLNVYPAANLFRLIPMNCDGYIIDPNLNYFGKEYNFINEVATSGTQRLLEILES